MPATLEEFKRAFSGQSAAPPAVPSATPGKPDQSAKPPGDVKNLEQTLLQLKNLVEEYVKTDLTASKYQTGLVGLAKRYAEAMNAVAPMPKITEMLEKVYQDAQSMITELQGLLVPYREYAKVRDVALSKYAECFAVARSYLALFPERANLQSFRYSMFDAAKKGDFTNATAWAKQIETKAAEYLKACVAEQKKYDELGAKILKSIKDASWFSEDNVTRDWINNKLNAAEIKFLPAKVRNRMMEELHEGVFSDDDKAAMKKLYSVRTLDPEFEKAEKKKRDAYIEKMKNDPEFVKARKDWATMDKDQKMKVLEKAANYHAEAYGTKTAPEAKPLKVKPFDTAPETDSAGNTSWTNGVYNPGNGTITINTNSSPLVEFNSFDGALDLITHEAGHRYQEVLAARVKNGKLKPGDPEYDQAVAFMWNDKYYIGEPQSIYETQPMESHSRVSGAAVQAANIGGTT